MPIWHKTCAQVKINLTAINTKGGKLIIKMFVLLLLGTKQSVHSENNSHVYPLQTV